MSRLFTVFLVENKLILIYEVVLFQIDFQCFLNENVPNFGFMILDDEKLEVKNDENL